MKRLELTFLFLSIQVSKTIFSYFTSKNLFLNLLSKQINKKTSTGNKKRKIIRHSVAHKIVKKKVFLSFFLLAFFYTKYKSRNGQ